MDKVLCKNCDRFYNTGADQCNIPNVGITMLDALNKEGNSE